MSAFLVVLLAVVGFFIPDHHPDVCLEWGRLTGRLGLSQSERSQAHDIMWRESRCMPTATNPKDPNGGSIGLFQINMFWCKPSRWSPDGWLQSQGVLRSCDDLYDPEVNVAAFAAIYRYGVDKHGDGWGPWRP